MGRLAQSDPIVKTDLGMKPKRILSKSSSVPGPPPHICPPRFFFFFFFRGGRGWLSTLGCTFPSLARLSQAPSSTPPPPRLSGGLKNLGTDTPSRISPCPVQAHLLSPPPYPSPLQKRKEKKRKKLAPGFAFLSLMPLSLHTSLGWGGGCPKPSFLRFSFTDWASSLMPTPELRKG